MWNILMAIKLSSLISYIQNIQNLFFITSIITNLALYYFNSLLTFFLKYCYIISLAKEYPFNLIG